MAPARKFKELEARVGYHFKNRDLLKKALTHASVRQASSKRRDNERLEFLGDRVLGLVIAELLCEVYPSANEGDLAKLYNRLVRGGTCAAIARELDLGPFLVLSEAEADSGGRDKETILADACEALLGAIFLEAGYETAQKSCAASGARASGLPRRPMPPTPSRCCRSGRRARASICRPTWRSTARGPTTRRASREVRIRGRKPARGEGASKRAAEQAAATALLAREGVWKRGADA